MNFLDCLEELEDTRYDTNKTYELVDIIFLTMAAVVSGAAGWKDIERFGRLKLDWLREHRPFESGIPTCKSIGRIIRTISEQALMTCFAVWINEQRSQSGAEHIAFDGKTLKGSGRNRHKEALHLMSAIVAENGLTLHQCESIGKKNEIETMQNMLDTIPVHGHVLSADAMHCQTKTLSKAVEKGADVVLQVKDNQKCLKEEIAAYFHKVKRNTPEAIAIHSDDMDGEHGRLTERTYRLLPASEWVSRLKDWPGIKSLIEVTRTHHHKEEIVTETCYHVSTLSDVTEISRVIRNHWRIESHHWILDVTFREDESQIYAEDGAKNMALFRRLLMTMMKAHPLKDSVAGKLKRAAWDDEFRTELFFGQKASKV